MSAGLGRLLPLGELTASASPAIPDASVAGAKAARLAAARAAGFPVLPGWVLPAAESRPAIRAAAAAVRGGRPAAARRAALACAPDPALAGELRAAVHSLGGRVIVRSSSALEHDPRWAGAFSSVAEVGPGDVVTAVRSCWAAAFAVDPLARLDACGLPLDALELGILIQPELHPVAGGAARVRPAGGGTARPAADDPAEALAAADDRAQVGPTAGGTARPGPLDVQVDGVRGHPGPLLAGLDRGGVRTRSGWPTRAPRTGRRPPLPGH